MLHKPNFSEHFFKHHVECKLVLLICKHQNYEMNITPTTAVLKRTGQPLILSPPESHFLE